MSANVTQGRAVHGYDRVAVEAWIAAHVPGLAPPLTWTRLEGGHSNLTYLLEDAGGRRVVIRRPPLGELLPKAHDMAREWALISALGPTSVPVPAALGFCEDTTVTGAAFYVMGHVEGHPLHDVAEAERLIPEPLRPKLAHAFIDVLADLHAVDPEAVGLGDLGKRDSYVGRQLATWHRSWRASAEAAQYDDPRAHDLQRRLLAHLPEQGPARLVHGDYGFHNCLVTSEGTIAAVVDWEISTLGDPLADLAYALLPWPDPTDLAPPVPGAATTAVGFPTRSALAARYASRTGRDLGWLDYYTGFSQWKSAAIRHGVYARYKEGKKDHAGVDLDDLVRRVDESLAAAERALARFGV